MTWRQRAPGPPPDWAGGTGEPAEGPSLPEPPVLREPPTLREPPVLPGAAARTDREIQLDVARQIALKQLTMAPRSRSQLADVLARRGCPPEIADEVLNRLEGVGLVDDQAFAGLLVRSQQATRGLAKRALAHELRRRGVDDETAAAALDEVDPRTEEDQARALVAKRMRSLHGLDITVQTRRLAGLLARKGYDSALALRVIREVLADAPEHHRD